MIKGYYKDEKATSENFTPGLFFFLDAILTLALTSSSTRWIL